MWWVKTDSSGEERGGFQNRDIGKVSFDKDYGPDYGVDYARFADEPDIVKDMLLLSHVKEALASVDLDLQVSVRNKFVIIKGLVEDEDMRSELIQKIRSVDGVVEVINDLHIRQQ